MFHQSIKCQLNRDSGIKDYDFPTRSQNTEAVVELQAGSDCLPPRSSDDFLLVGQTHSTRRKIVGTQTGYCGLLHIHAPKIVLCR